MPAMLKRLPPYSGIRLSTSNTRAPREGSRRAKFEPMNPSAPVINTRRSANAPSSSTIRSFRHSVASRLNLSLEKCGLGQAPTSAKSEKDWIHFVTLRRRRGTFQLKADNHQDHRIVVWFEIAGKILLHPLANDDAHIIHRHRALGAVSRMQLLGVIVFEQFEIERRQIIADRRRVEAEQPRLAELGGDAGFVERVAISRLTLDHLLEHVVEGEPHPRAAERVNLAQRARHRLRRQVIRNAHPHDQRAAAGRETGLPQLLDEIVPLEIDRDKAQILRRADAAHHFALDRLRRRMVRNSSAPGAQTPTARVAGLASQPNSASSLKDGLIRNSLAYGSQMMRRGAGWNCSSARIAAITSAVRL